MTIASKFAFLTAVLAVSIASPALAQDEGAGYPPGYSLWAAPTTIQHRDVQKGRRVFNEVRPASAGQTDWPSAAALGNQR
jgi:hypothetical protein